MKTPKSNTPVVLAIAFTAFALLSALVLAQPQSSEPAFSGEAVRKAVLETNAKMLEAANRMDADSFFAHILDSDQTVIIDSGTLFKSRAEAFQAVKGGFRGLAKLDRQFTNPQVTVLSPDVALLTAEGTVAATLTDGRSIDSRFAVSLVFVKKEGEWKLLHGHHSTPPRT